MERWERHAPNPKTRKVVGHVEAIRGAIESDVVFRRRDVHRRRHVVGETPVLVKVDDDEPGQVSVAATSVSVPGASLHIVPVRGVPDVVVQVLQHRRPRSKVARRVHRVDGAAFRVDVRESRQLAGGEILVELIGVDELVHGVLLNPLVKSDREFTRGSANLPRTCTHR